MVSIAYHSRSTLINLQQSPTVVVPLALAMALNSVALQMDIVDRMQTIVVLDVKLHMDTVQPMTVPAAPSAVQVVQGTIAVRNMVTADRQQTIVVPDVRLDMVYASNMNCVGKLIVTILTF